jgi:hypothetical protein
MAERVTVEQNGERITLEVPDGTSDEQIQSFLSGGATPKQTTIGDVADKAFQTALPATYVPGPTGFNAGAVKQTLSPLVEAGKSAVTGYAKNPLTAAVDIGMTSMGLPPPYATVQTGKGLYNTYQGARAAVNTAQGLASAIAETPGVEKSFNKLIDALPKADALRMNELINKRGAQGLKEFIDSAPDAIKALPEAKELAGMVPSRMAQVGKVAGPALRAAGKVLGPAGLALNAYDAQQYAEASKLGERLGAGQGQFAQQAFRNQALNKPTPAPLQPNEAANLLASGDQRTIQIYGGQQHLEQIAGGKSPNAPPTADNFLERIKAMANHYGRINPGQ